MSQLNIELYNLRIIRFAAIEFGPGINIVLGGNGSGKTSLIEGLFLLGRGKSYRSRSLSSVMTTNADFLRVIGNTINSLPINIGFEFNALSRKTQIRIAGKTAKRSSQLALSFPVLLVNPDSHRLLENERNRRRVMDWGVFHVEPTFGIVWRQYLKALSQRNAIIKAEKKIPHLWDVALSKYGSTLDEMRNRYIEELKISFKTLTSHFINVKNFNLAYSCGWNCKTSLEDYLISKKNDDLYAGYTRMGPHRADLQINLNGNSFCNFVSAGEQKILTICLFLSQVMLLRSKFNIEVTLLIDDLAAELDVNSRRILIILLNEIGCTTIITCNDRSLLQDYLTIPPYWFHVEQGVFNRLD